MIRSDDATLATLQRSAYRKYVGGATGVAVSGVVWLIAGAVAANSGVALGFTTLFFGGMIIFPAAALLARLIAPAEAKVDSAAMDRLGLESTAMLFAGLLLAYLLLDKAPSLVFPAAALAIGVRYFVFRTLYGESLYWALGAAIAASATLAALGYIPAATLPGLIGLIEIGFAIAIALRWRKSPP